MYGIYHIKGNQFIKFSNSLRGIKITLARYNKNAGYIAYEIREVG